MVYRRERPRRFVMRSVRAVSMKRFLLAIIIVCLTMLVFTISMEAGLRSSAEVAGTGMMPVGLTFSV
ncbi:MAG: hypothetical protein IIX93_06010 [Clostridia bacterium]|nr:hypothetical protein [Clostridia bacterium]MBQ2434160.1 hypothetical protein [Clostridia bacterium]